MAARASLAVLLSLLPWAPCQHVDDEKLRTSACVFDVLQATGYLHQAGLKVYSSVDTCEQPNPNSNLCAVDITGIVNSFINVGSFLAAAASNCAPETNAQAGCAASITGIVAAIAGVAEASAALAHTCTSHSGRRLNASGADVADGADGTAADAATDADSAADATAVGTVAAEVAASASNQTIVQRMAAARRLQTTDDPVDIAWCVVDVLQATYNLGRAGIEITGATEACPAEEAECAATVSGTIAAFSNVASYLAAAASHCALGVHMEALCAADVTHLVNELAAVAATGSLAATTCEGASQEDVLLP